MQVALVAVPQLLRDELASALDGAAGSQVVGEASTPAEGPALVELLKPDVLVTGTPKGQPGELLKELRGGRPTLAIVVMGSEADDDQLIAALGAGASGFVGASAPLDDVMTAIRAAHASPHTFTTGDLAGSLQRRMALQHGRRLAPRESQVLELIVEGRTVGQVAQQLDISESMTNVVCQVRVT